MRYDDDDFWQDVYDTLKIKRKYRSDEMPLEIKGRKFPFRISFGDDVLPANMTFTHFSSLLEKLKNGEVLELARDVLLDFEELTEEEQEAKFKSGDYKR